MAPFFHVGSSFLSLYKADFYCFFKTVYSHRLKKSNSGCPSVHLSFYCIDSFRNASMGFTCTSFRWCPLKRLNLLYWFFYSLSFSLYTLFHTPIPHMDWGTHFFANTCMNEPVHVQLIVVMFSCWREGPQEIGWRSTG